MNTASGQIRHLPLHEKHVQKGAKLGNFGGWEVPLYYTSILEEHEAVRRRAGLFDISHMGEFFISGSGAEGFLERVLPRTISTMPEGKALYMPLLNDRGGILDDIILYRFSPARFLMIVNAANIEKDFRWLKSCGDQLADSIKSPFKLENQSDERGLLALQGPLSAAIVEKAFGIKSSGLGYYHFQPWQSGMIARTGYTGEDGFEVMVDLKELREVWERLFKAGADLGLVSVGFGTRDTLRLEAAMLLYGHDMDEDISPLEAGIRWAIELDKPSFIGKESLLAQQKEGIKRKLIGFEMIDRGIPRQDFLIEKNGALIGHVTSGSFAPTLQKNIGLGYIAVEEANPGNEIDIIIRGKPVKAKVVKIPFYKRPKN